MKKIVIGIIAILCAGVFTYLIQTRPEPQPISFTNFMNPARKHQNIAQKKNDSTIKNDIVKKGKTIKVMYVGTLDDGSLFDTNIASKAKEAGTFNKLNPYEPLEFTVGAGQMIPGFDSGVEGMKLNETKKIHIPAGSEGYGMKNDALIKSFSAEELNNQKAPWKDWIVGKKYIFQTSVGPQPGILIEKNEKGIRLDFNHELAGKALNFEVTIVSIK